MKLADVVSIARQFQRSVRVDSDIGQEAALKGYICQGSARHALESMAHQFQEAGQRAFTWTGPFGGGKSSLAVVLATFLSGTAALRKAASEILGNEASELVKRAFQLTREPWIVVPAVGHKSDLVRSLHKALELHGPTGIKRRLAKVKNGRDLVHALVKLAEDHPKAGIFIVIDELGKFLEYAAANEGDIYFLQDLAEAAARSKGRLVVLGVLHQSFEQYAHRLGHEHRDEWAKIQGRFADIPLIAAIDEVVDLTSRAIVTGYPHPFSKVLAEKTAKSIRVRRKGTPPDLAQRLDDCWPLHPATAALLGPASKRRFGQNERSTFGFLSSAEPLGFREFLENVDADACVTFEPSLYWGYLRTNLEPAILASPDGHRWSQAVDAVERCESKGTSLHLRLIKAIAVLDIFRNGSGLVADRAVLGACLSDISSDQVDALLSDLERWSVAIFRKHLDSWAIFSGSDFDIEGAVRATLSCGIHLDLSKLSELAALQPVLAKRLYYETGTLRWFQTELASVEELRGSPAAFDPRDGAAGKFVLVLPTANESLRTLRRACQDASQVDSEYPVLIGAPENAELIREYGTELIALHSVRRERPELDGDPVARRELAARTTEISARLEEELRSALLSAQWYFHGEAIKLERGATITGLASTIAEQTFPNTPRILSELINRQRPSSNTQGAIRQLLWAMVKNPSIANLGLEGFSAERGLHATTLQATSLHVERTDGCGFVIPKKGSHQDALVKLWKVADNITSDTSKLTLISDLYRIWSKPPFGIRRGLLPILTLTYVLSNVSRLAVYRDSIYQPELNEVLADVLLQDASLIALRRVHDGEQHAGFISALVTAVRTALGISVAAEPLEIARSMVGFAMSLSPWARRTTAVSQKAQGLRRLLLDAHDPHKLLIVDLPILFDATDPTIVGQHLADALSELALAYGMMLKDIQAKMLVSLRATQNDWFDLNRRAKVVVGISGDLRLDAFATRLSTFDGSLEQLEGIVSMAVNRPPRDWSDRDPDAAAMELANLALKFRQAEMLAAVKGRDPTRQAIAFVIGTGEAGEAVLSSFDIADSDRKIISGVAQNLRQVFSKAALPHDLLLAALAEVGTDLIKQTTSDKNGH